MKDGFEEQKYWEKEQEEKSAPSFVI